MSFFFHMISECQDSKVEEREVTYQKSRRQDIQIVRTIYTCFNDRNRDFRNLRESCGECEASGATPGDDIVERANGDSSRHDERL